jgi:diguanylate cyclase (GGDEF)-like protein
MNEFNSAFGPEVVGAPQPTPECNGEKGNEILILEDDPEIGRFYQMKLASPVRTIFIAQTMKAADQILDEHEITLILLDLTLPDADGRSFLHRVRANPRTSTVPIIVVSARRGPVSISECFDLGADEYFEKPIHPEVLVAAVAGKLKRDAELARRSRHDVLTGALNRLAFQDVFCRVQAISRRGMSPLALAILDLDRFKLINDKLGHPLGDQVLIRAAQVITRSLRRSDVVGRWGGDEFVVLMPDTDCNGARLALEAVRRALRDESIHGSEEEFRLSFSAGVVNVTGGVTLDEAVADADRLLYLAKAEKGRTFTDDKKTSGHPVEKSVDQEDMIQSK